MSSMQNSHIPRIVVIGSLNVDLTTIVDRMPRAGETIFGREFHLGFGGKGGNQAAAARLCGAEVAMVARVGDDLFGPATIDNLKQTGINTQYVATTPGASSGVAPIFVDSSGQNRILVVKGANDLLSAQDVDAAATIIEQADIVILQFEVPLDTVYHALDLAHARAVRTILNPAPAQPVDVTRLRNLDYLIPNETESEALTGRQIRGVEDARASAAQLLDMGLRQAVITLGANGAVFASPQGVWHIPAFEVTAVDTTGAGDAFIGSFGYFLASGLDEQGAIVRANLYAGLSTLKSGTRGAFPNREQWSAEWQKRRGKAGSPAVLG
jgi:ribokinase